MERGTRVGRYALAARLGHGGSGAVYRAVGPGGEDVAVKLLRPELAADAEARARLMREAQSLSRVQLPGVVQFLEVNVSGIRPYIVTELVEGPTLADDVEQHGPFAAADLLALAEDLATSLRAIHEAGVLHRDVTPRNVILSPNGPVLIDFGLAQSAEAERFTAGGYVMGTAGYVAPEDVESTEAHSLSVHGDWWAWSATIAFAGLGHPPFGRGTWQQIFTRLLRGDLADQDAPAPLQRILRAALHPEREHRASPEDTLEALSGWVAAESGQATTRLQAPQGITVEKPLPHDPRESVTDRLAVAGLPETPTGVPISSDFLPGGEPLAATRPRLDPDATTQFSSPAATQRFAAVGAEGGVGATARYGATSSPGGHPQSAPPPLAAPPPGWQNGGGAWSPQVTRTPVPFPQVYQPPRTYLVGGIGAFACALTLLMPNPAVILIPIAIITFALGCGSALAHWTETWRYDRQTHASPGVIRSAVRTPGIILGQLINVLPMVFLLSAAWWFLTHLKLMNLLSPPVPSQYLPMLAAAFLFLVTFVGWIFPTTNQPQAGARRLLAGTAGAPGIIVGTACWTAAIAIALLVNNVPWL
ncbi:serine/threonine-protein kinase [Buchananella hordeovulneris]|uniref:serine/threonine-protein kinase n=1 Tax=Buchananella hordeovulneris TaxID=52770 RepID=UPI0009FCF526|nr:serine/threonine-protein kinase [Buchananella hordeovulneris]